MPCLLITGILMYSFEKCVCAYCMPAWALLYFCINGHMSGLKGLQSDEEKGQSERVDDSMSNSKNRQIRCESGKTSLWLTICVWGVGKCCWQRLDYYCQDNISPILVDIFIWPQAACTDWSKRLSSIHSYRNKLRLLI